MLEPSTDPRHITKAVTDLGGVRPVVAAHPVVNTQGVTILEKGTALGPGLYERLMAHQLSSPLLESTTASAPLTGRMLRDSAAELMQTMPLFALLAPEERIRHLLLEIVERVPLPDPVAFQLTLAYEARPELYRHLLCSALVAAWLAMDAKISRFDMNIAAAAGLLHDLGALHLDPLLLDYKTEINRAQRRQLYSHPLISATLIEVHSEYSRPVVRAVMEHHEFLDGSGYPRNLAGDQISRFGRILALTELILGAFALGREAPELRLSIRLRMNTHRYDEVLCARVIGILGRQHGADGTSISLLDDPVASLLAIDGVLVGYPVRLADRKDLSPQRREALNALSGQASRLRRTLAKVGAAPEQLTQLGSEPLGHQLQTELTLLAGEAAWQLRTLAREVGRRWRAAPGTGFPEELQQWLDQVVGVVARVTGLLPAKADGESDDE